MVSLPPSVRSPKYVHDGRQIQKYYHYDSIVHKTNHVYAKWFRYSSTHSQTTRALNSQSKPASVSTHNVLPEANEKEYYEWPLKAGIPVS